MLPNYLLPLGMAVANRMSYRDPYGKAMEYFEPMESTLREYAQPYITQGRQLMPMVQESYQEMLERPEDIFRKAHEQFRETPGFRWGIDEMIKAANRAAAAGGMSGIPAQQEALARRVGEAAKREYYGSFLEPYLGLRETGLRGLSGLEQRGFGANQQFIQNLLNLQKERQNLEIERQKAEQRSRGGLLGGLVSAFF